MNLRAAIIASAICAFLGASDLVRAGAVDVLQWNLWTGVVDSTPSIPQIDVRRSETPENPFIVAQNASLGPTAIANGHYDVSWLNDSGSFHLEADQFLHGPRRGASSGGQFYFATSIDLIFNASGELNFASSPGDEADFYYGIGLDLVDFGSIPVWSDFSIGGDSHFEVPASGSLSFASDDILLSAGSTYKVTLTFSSGTSPFTDQDPISADGELNFSWRPVPEPSSALLLAFAGVAVFRRRRRPSVLPAPQVHDAPSPPSP